MNDADIYNIRKRLNWYYDVYNKKDERFFFISDQILWDLISIAVSDESSIDDIIIARDYMDSIEEPIAQESRRIVI